MSVANVPISPFTKILNFRDVGKTVNILLGKHILQEGRLFRSARPDDAPRNEKAAISSTYSIHNIIDLRSKSEHDAQAEKHASDPFTSTPPATTHFISLTGPAFERALVWKLSWGNMGKLLYHLTFSPRPLAIRTIATHAMAPTGLLGLAYTTLLSSTHEICFLLHLLAAPGTYPLLIHCTQGKDRTGLIIILILLLCDIPVEVIGKDYRASERELQPEMEERIKELEGMGLGPEFARCPDGFVEGVVGFLGERWGGVEGYLDGIGVGAGLREEVRRSLMIDVEVVSQI